MKALKFEVSGSRGRPKQTLKKQVENEMKKNGLVKEDECDRTKLRGVVKKMTIRNPANSVDGDNTGSNVCCDQGRTQKFLKGGLNFSKSNQYPIVVNLAIVKQDSTVIVPSLQHLFTQKPCNNDFECSVMQTALQKIGDQFENMLSTSEGRTPPDSPFSVPRDCIIHYYQ